MLSINDNLKFIHEEIASTAEFCGRKSEDILLVAVSKFREIKDINTALEAGHEVFGENYVQELKDKIDYFANKPQKPVWHYIGHLQTNKVKYIVDKIEMLQTIDSVNLATEVSKFLKKSDCKLEVLIQVNTSGEMSKSGCDPDAAIELVNNVLKLPNLYVNGLMTIGSFSNNERVYRKEFILLRKLFDDINSQLGLKMKHLSMGMTNDFQAAIEEGSTIVRIGTAIFGER
ncbi:MAG: YggS family pyridoxal phosphate-dependent enzyme [Candidatus Kapabacteria bacterium]|nr:YggS family pyridoxal phosphate-dependent enzyme [Candidatus Kapabacteria bacterium]